MLSSEQGVRWCWMSNKWPLKWYYRDAQLTIYKLNGIFLTLLNHQVPLIYFTQPTAHKFSGSCQQKYCWIISAIYSSVYSYVLQNGGVAVQILSPTFNKDCLHPYVIKKTTVVQDIITDLITIINLILLHSSIEKLLQSF